ncbi:unnamed protein product [Urochloa decumbens]|uniref:KIB1-4 beta-propeller domain-containing protein n=1 Tax=Urochloa decumbens TaxID=240449 RepID=A0ABC8ZDU0_9POAL
MSPPPPLSPKRASGPGATTPCCRSVKCRRLLSPREEARPWASLPEDLVQLIGWRVLAADLLDYVRLRAVCAHWNRSAIRPRGHGLVDPRFHPRRWMLLPEGHGLYPGHPHLGGYVRFFNLSTGAFVRCHLPLFHDHIILDSIDGLLLLLLHRDHGTGIRLLHPFTGDIAELPTLMSLLPQIEFQPRYLNMSEDQKLCRLRIFLRGVSAAVTISDARTITVMVVLPTESRLALATAGDERWTLSAWKLPMLLAPAVFFQGKMYTVSRRLSEKNVVFIHQIDPPQLNFEDPQSLSLHPPTMIAKCLLVGTMGTLIHLVECGLELMLVGRLSDASGPHLVVYRIADLVCGRIAPVKDIGDHALFLGNRSVSVLANKGFPSVLGNSITCRHISMIQKPPVGSRRRKRVEQYHLHTGTWSPAIEEDILPCQDSLASPYSLVHHIYTCSYRNYWNMGLIFSGAIAPDWSVKPNLWTRVISM